MDQLAEVFESMETPWNYYSSPHEFPVDFPPIIPGSTLRTKFLAFPIKSWDPKIFQKKLLNWSKSCVSMKQTKCKNKKIFAQGKSFTHRVRFCFWWFLNFFWQNFSRDVSWWTRGWSMRWQSQTFEISFGSRQKVMKFQKANHFWWRGQTNKQHLLFIWSKS